MIMTGVCSTNVVHTALHTGSLEKPGSLYKQYALQSRNKA